MRLRYHNKTKQRHCEIVLSNNKKPHTRVTIIYNFRKIVLVDRSNEKQSQFKKASPSLKNQVPSESCDKSRSLFPYNFRRVNNNLR